MFYSQFILAKKGPLGTIWIAAHLERKLRKNQVADTDIGVSVDSIIFPEVPIALRLSSHLLLGVVRIYSRKVGYLFDDCSEALLKVKQAFRSTAVDLPPEQSKAPYHSITLPETFDLDDFELPDNEIFQGNYVDHHVSSREQITLQDTMDGVTYSTSQFGPDERFGDGDASQIGLDLDEDLFLDKGEAAGPSGTLGNIDADCQASPKEDNLSKGDEPNQRVSDCPLASPTNHFSIQAPSTPRLMEEPNLPSAQDVLVSDDHMDEDQKLPELSAKEVSGGASSQAAPSNLNGPEFVPNGDCHHLIEQENEEARLQRVTPSSEGTEPASSGLAQQPKFDEHLEGENGSRSSESKLACSPLQNEKHMATENQCDGRSDHDELEVNGVSLPSEGKPAFGEIQGHDSSVGNGEADLNVTSTEDTERIMVSSGSECQNGGQPCLNLKVKSAFESNGDTKFSALGGSVLQACNSRDHACHNGVDNSACAFNLPAEDDGLCFISGKENACDVSGISIDDQDVTAPTLKEDQTALEVINEDDNDSDKLQDNIGSREDRHLKGNTSEVSNFSAPEKMLSAPNLPVGQPDDVLTELTPDKEVLAEGVDANGEKLMSGRKRSYTESTLTIQSLTSAESSGAAQSKQSTEFVPDDDDLLSSILVGKRSTTLKMKPTPPLTENVPAKRQRTSVRASALKRKVLVDDTMVLHGDTIREQLTSTEDIRRVRKKAPCTCLEVWVLQKQFLEDEIFCEPIFTGMSFGLKSSYSEAVDISGIRIVQDDESKGSNETVTSTRPVSAEEGVPSTDGDLGRQEHVDGLEGTSGRQESTFVVDGSSLQKELETFDNEVAKQMLQYDVSGKKVESENDDGSVITRDEANDLVTLGTEQTFQVGPVSVVSGDLTANTTVDAPSINKAVDVGMSMDIDTSCQLNDQECGMDYTREDVSTRKEDVSGSGRGDQKVVDVDVSEKLGSEEKSNGQHLLENVEGMDKAEAVLADTNPCDPCSLPIDNDTVGLEGRASPAKETQLGDPIFAQEDEILATDQRHDGSRPTSNNLVEEDVKLDSLHPEEADMSSQNARLNEMENLECWEANPNIDMISAATPIDFNDSTVHSDIGMEAIEHDTDFLNVDDDDVAEDYESDMPNPEEKHLLDNSGWSSRTRAVANYLQVLFEKEAPRTNKVISLESLLAGKSRKEASRMFFETLVLKTKDYIHAEQESSFCDLKIKPTGKLLKSEF